MLALAVASEAWDAGNAAIGDWCVFVIVVDDDVGGVFKVPFAICGMLLAR